jgi:hypothetical protein
MVVEYNPRREEWQTQTGQKEKDNLRPGFLGVAGIERNSCTVPYV